MAHGIDLLLYDSETAGVMLTFRANPEHVQAALEQGTVQEPARLSRLLALRTKREIDFGSANPTKEELYGLWPCDQFSR